MTPEEARTHYETLYGPIEEEAWAEIAADVTDWDQFFSDRASQDASQEPPVEGEIPEPDDEAAPPEDEVPVEEPADAVAVMASMNAAITGITSQLETLQSQYADLSTRHTEITAALAAQERATEIAATVIDVHGVGHRYAQSAVQVLASVMANPNAETATALVDHLNANGGSMCLVPVTEIGASLNPADPNDDEAYLLSLGETEKAVAAIREIAASMTKPDMRAAAKEFYRSLNPR